MESVPERRIAFFRRDPAVFDKVLAVDVKLPEVLMDVPYVAYTFGVATSHEIV